MAISWLASEYTKPSRTRHHCKSGFMAASIILIVAYRVEFSIVLPLVERGNLHAHGGTYDRIKLVPLR